MNSLIIFDFILNYEWFRKIDRKPKNTKTNLKNICSSLLALITFTEIS